MILRSIDLSDGMFMDKNVGFSTCYYFIASQIRKKNKLQEKHTMQDKYKIRQNFTAQWFTLSMSWGLISLLIKYVPVKIYTNHATLSNILDITAEVIFYWNLVYFFLFLIILSTSRNAIKRSLNDTPDIFFLGAILMDFASVISGVAGVMKLGELAFILWWLDILLAIVVFYYILLKLISTTGPFGSVHLRIQSSLGFILLRWYHYH